MARWGGPSAKAAAEGGQPVAAGRGGGKGKGSASQQQGESGTSSGSVAAAVGLEIGMYFVSALFSYAVLRFGFHAIDPSRKEKDENRKRKHQLAKRLNKPDLKTTQYEDTIASDVINPHHVDVSLDDVGGLDHAKDSLSESVIFPLSQPELFSSHGSLLTPPKGVLLYGPPGTGKTMLAKALAKQSNSVFINVRISTLQSKWFGEAQKLVSAIFSLAHKLQPAIIFIDEVDALLGTRGRSDHEATNSMKTEFMSSWDGMLTDPKSSIVVVAATNRPWDVDDAILRRLPRTFEIGMPHAEERERILRSLLKKEKVAADFDYKRIAQRSEGYTGSDLQDLAKQAAMFPLREAMETGNATNSNSRDSASSVLESKNKSSSSTASTKRSRRHSRTSTAQNQQYHNHDHQQESQQKPNMRSLATKDFEQALSNHRPSNETAAHAQQVETIRSYARAAKVQA
jgi:SpoVK/Ycf46/Vps4 family AAA+-type ATPase